MHRQRYLIRVVIGFLKLSSIQSRRNTMPFDLVFSPNQSNINIKIKSQRFRNIRTLPSEKIQSDTLPLKTFQGYLDEGTNFLTELTEGQQHQEMREPDLSGTPGDLAREHDHTSTIITNPAVPRV